MRKRSKFKMSREALYQTVRGEARSAGQNSKLSKNVISTSSSSLSDSGVEDLKALGAMGLNLRRYVIASTLGVFQDLISSGSRFRNKFGMTDKKGFTLIELIVVIGVLSIFAVILFSTIDPLAQFQKANDGRRKSDLAQIQRVLEQYYQDNGKYPDSNASFQIERLDDTAVTRAAPAWIPYMNEVPFDPNETKEYIYYSRSNGQEYYIYASLDRAGKDPQACNGGDACATLGAGAFPSTTACGGTCNYGVSSPNVSP